MIHGIHITHSEGRDGTTRVNYHSRNAAGEWALRAWTELPKGKRKHDVWLVSAAGVKACHGTALHRTAAYDMAHDYTEGMEGQ
jgi:hypothetical protein